MANSSTLRTRPQGKTILLAEDDAVVRSLMNLILGRAGYDVIAVEDGLAAVRAFVERQFAIDLLVFDMRMPQLDGFSAYAQIKAVHSGVPVLFCSGFCDQMLGFGLPLPATARMLNKPFSPDELLHHVTEMLEEVALSVERRNLNATDGVNRR